MTHLLARRLVYPRVRNTAVDIPPEIISTIVAFAHASTPGHAKSLLDYARVNYIWRQTIYSSPRLWTFLALGMLGISPSTSVEAMVNGAKQWFARSKALPVSLNLDIKRINREDARTLMTGLLDPENSSVKWHKITLGPRFVDALAALPPCRFGPCRFASIETLDVPQFRWPRVASLTLSSYNIIAFSSFPAPWATLRALHISSPSWAADYLSILIHCTALEELSLSVLQGNFYDDIEALEDATTFVPRETVLPKLQKLMLHDAPVASRILDVLTLPALTQVAFHRMPTLRQDAARSQVQRLADLIARSGACVTHLRITAEEMLPVKADIAPLLPYLDGLTHLVAGYTDGSYLPLVNALAGREYLGSLRCVNIIAAIGVDVWMGAFEKIIRRPNLSRIDVQLPENWRGDRRRVVAPKSWNI